MQTQYSIFIRHIKYVLYICVQTNVHRTPFLKRGSRPPRGSKVAGGVELPVCTGVQCVSMCVLGGGGGVGVSSRSVGETLPKETHGSAVVHQGL